MDRRLTSIGGGSPTWPILPKSVLAAWLDVRYPPPHGAGSTTGVGHGAGSTTGVGHRGGPHPPPHHGAGSTMGLGIGRGCNTQPALAHGAGSTTAPPGAVPPPGPPGSCARTASNRVNRSSILFRLSST